MIFARKLKIEWRRIKKNTNTRFHMLSQLKTNPHTHCVINENSLTIIFILQIINQPLNPCNSIIIVFLVFFFSFFFYFLVVDQQIRFLLLCFKNWVHNVGFFQFIKLLTCECLFSIGLVFYFFCVFLCFFLLLLLFTSFYYSNQFCFPSKIQKI